MNPAWRSDRSCSILHEVDWLRTVCGWWYDDLPRRELVRVRGTRTTVLMARGSSRPWPAPAPEPAPPDERARVVALAAHPDCGSLAPFCTRADRTYTFSPDGAAAVGYRVVFGTALVGGDPVGAVESAPAAVDAFLRTCDRQRWRPAVLGAGGRMVEVWRAAGVRRGLVIGDEAILGLASFSMESRRMRNVRQAVARTRNAGVRVTIGPLDSQTAQELRPVLDDWLRGRPERGFAMNLDAVLRPRPDCVFAIARDRAGCPQAFARFAICGAGRILTLDVAPRRGAAPNGVVERLFFEIACYGRDRGAVEVSLNFAGLRSVLTSTWGPARLMRQAARAFDRWIQLAPLYVFVAKFQPQWRARWLLMRSWSDLGWVALAALVAEFRPQVVRVADRVAYRVAYRVAERVARTAERPEPRRL